MAIFGLFLYVFVNLTSILYLGTLAINNLTGGNHFHLIMICLAVFALIITLGGMKVIGYTDVIQVVVLIVGGLVASYIALTVVSEKFGYGNAGFNQLFKSVPGHFNMIFDKPVAGTSQQDINHYASLPGLTMLAAGMWVANLLLGLQPIHYAKSIGRQFKNCPNRNFICSIFKIDGAPVSGTARHSSICTKSEW